MSAPMPGRGLPMTAADFPARPRAPPAGPAPPGPLIRRRFGPCGAPARESEHVAR